MYQSPVAQSVGCGCKKRVWLKQLAQVPQAPPPAQAYSAIRRP